MRRTSKSCCLMLLYSISDVYASRRLRVSTSSCRRKREIYDELGCDIACYWMGWYHRMVHNFVLFWLFRDLIQYRCSRPNIYYHQVSSTAVPPLLRLSHKVHIVLFTRSTHTIGPQWHELSLYFINKG
jgi:hypothetical protein